MDLWARVKLILCDSFRKKDISEKCQYYVFHFLHSKKIFKMYIIIFDYKLCSVHS